MCVSTAKFTRDYYWCASELGQFGKPQRDNPLLRDIKSVSRTPGEWITPMPGGGWTYPPAPSPSPTHPPTHPGYCTDYMCGGGVGLGGGSGAPDTLGQSPSGGRPDGRGAPRACWAPQVTCDPARGRRAAPARANMCIKYVYQSGRPPPPPETLSTAKVSWNRAPEGRGFTLSGLR